MAVTIGSKSAQLVNIVHLTGLEHIDIVSNDIRTGKISIDSKGNKVIGSNTEYFLATNTIGTVVSEDINAGKTIYVNGELITGTYTEPTLDTAVRGITKEYTVKNGHITSGSFVKIVNDTVINSSTSVGTNTQSSITDSVAYATDVKLIKLSDTKAVIIYTSSVSSTNSNRLPRARVLTISGATVTSGPEFVINTSNSGTLGATLVSGNTIMVTYTDRVNDTYNSMVRVLTVDGNTITSGAPYSFKNTSISDPYITRLTDSSVAITYYDSDEEECVLKVLNISGTTIHETLSALYGNNRSSRPRGIVRLSSDKILIFFYGSSYYGGEVTSNICVADIANTQISIKPYISFSTGTFSYLNVVYLSENRFLLAYNDNNDANKVNVLIITVTRENTITLGTIYSNINTSIIRSLSAVKVSENKICIMYTDAFYDDKGTALILNISGDTITWNETLRFPFTKIDARYLSSVVLDYGKILVAYADSIVDTAYPVNVSLLSVDFTTDKVSSNIINYSVTVTPYIAPLDITRGPIAGIAMSDGDPGDSVTVKVPF